MARAYYPTRTGAAEGDASPVMAAINYPVSIYCAVVDQCSPTFLEEPGQLK